MVPCNPVQYVPALLRELLWRGMIWYGTLLLIVYEKYPSLVLYWDSERNESLLLEHSLLFLSLHQPFFSYSLPSFFLRDFFFFPLWLSLHFYSSRLSSPFSFPVAITYFMVVSSTSYWSLLGLSTGHTGHMKIIWILFQAIF